MTLERIRNKVAWRRRQRQGVVIDNDDFLNWMEFANAGMLHRGQRHLIHLAVRDLPTNDPVVEIGVFAGLSTNVISYYLRKHDRPNRLVSVDPWIFEGEGEPGIDFDAYRELVMEQYVRNITFWNGQRLPAAVRSTSDEFFAAWARGEDRTDLLRRKTRLGGTISFCFIDGDHRLDQAERDFRNADRFLAPGGFILFDDSDRFGAWPHLYELVRRILRDGRYELVGENPHHLLRKLG